MGSEVTGPWVTLVWLHLNHNHCCLFGVWGCRSTTYWALVYRTSPVKRRPSTTVTGGWGPTGQIHVGGGPGGVFPKPPNPILSRDRFSPVCFDQSLPKYLYPSWFDLDDVLLDEALMDIPNVGSGIRVRPTAIAMAYQRAISSRWAEVYKILGVEEGSVYYHNYQVWLCSN